MELPSGTRICVFALLFTTAVLAGCSDEPDDRKQAVYRSEPVRSQPVPGYGQQFQYPNVPHTPRAPYPPPPVSQHRPAPRFEISDPGNPWAYNPAPQYSHPETRSVPGQPWAETRPGEYPATGQQEAGSAYRFGGYRPLESEKPKDQAAAPSGMPPGAPYPYYPAPYPYGGGAPYGGYPLTGWPGIGWPPVW